MLLLEGHGGGGQGNGSAGGSTNLKGSQSFKEYKRATSVPTTRPALQVRTEGVVFVEVGDGKVVSVGSKLLIPSTRGKRPMKKFMYDCCQLQHLSFYRINTLKKYPFYLRYNCNGYHT